MLKRMYRTAVVMFAALFAAFSAYAADPVIETAKTQGLIGERSDGYLGFVTSSNDVALQRLVAEINAKRREAYTRLANQTGQSVSDIATLTAEKQFSRAAAGQYLYYPEGVWRRKN